MPSESRMTAVPRSYTHRWYDAHRVVIALVSFVVAILGVVSMVIWSGLAAATMENAVQNVKIEHIDVALDGVRSRQQEMIVEQRATNEKLNTILQRLK